MQRDVATALEMSFSETRTVIKGTEGFDLLGSVTERRPEALAELYERYSDLVFRLAYRITESAADAADVTQDVFIGLPEALPALRSETWEGFEAWLKTISVRSALQMVRKRKRLREVMLSPSVLGSVPARIDSAVDRIAIDRAVSQLSADQRAVYTLKEMEGLSHGEVGMILGISVGASEARLHRARRRLYHLLGSGR